MCKLVTLLVVLTLALNQAPDGGTNKILLLSIEPDVKELAVYEPLHLSVALRNAGAAPLEVPVVVLNNLEFYLKEKGKDWELVGYGSNRGLVLGVHVLTPGKAVLSGGVLLLRRSKADDRFVFGRPGTYELKARLTLEDGSVLESTAVKVEVREPTADERTAAQLFTWSVRAGEMGQRVTTAESMAVLEELVAKFPKTAYADHANLELGGDYYRQYSDSYDQRRGGDESKAVAAFRRYAGVSRRVAALRARALLRQTDLAMQFAEVRRLADLPKLAAEIEASFSATDAMEIGQALRKRHAELKRLLPQAGPSKP